MSRLKREKITCPVCSNEKEIAIWASVNVDINPETKEQILNREFFNWRCDNCGQKFHLIYSCLYHDMSNKLMIYLIANNPKNSKAELANLQQLSDQMRMFFGSEYRLTAVFSENELIEKIKIVDCGKDYRIIELYKVILRNELFKTRPNYKVEHIYFDSSDDKEFFVFLDNEGKCLATEFRQELYHGLEEDFMDKVGKYTANRFDVIDLDWAVNVLNDVWSDDDFI